MVRAQLSGHPREVRMPTVHTLVGEMPTCVETSEMAANSVKQSLPSLPDEPHPLNYFPFFKRSIETSACRKAQRAGK